MIVNSLSGGKSSSYMGIHYPSDVNIFACVCIDYPKAEPKDKSILKYAQDKLNGNFIASAESDLTLKVMMQLEQLLGKEIIWVRGKSFDKVIDEAGCLPTWARRFCTTQMKILPIFEYVYFRFGHTKMNIGIRLDEFSRLKRMSKNPVSIIKDYPISCNNFGHKRQNRSDIEYSIKQFPLGKTFHYQIQKYWQENHPEFIFPQNSNCMGCHHKPKEIIKLNYVDRPEIMEWFSLQEKKGNFNTWQDDRTTYDDIFEMKFDNIFTGIDDFTMCDSGGCTD
jgi:hypothetical protein